MNTYMYREELSCFTFIITKNEPLERTIASINAVGENYTHMKEDEISSLFM